MKDNDQVKIYENYLAAGMQQMNEDEAVATPSTSTDASMGTQGLIQGLKVISVVLQDEQFAEQVRPVITALRPIADEFNDLTVDGLAVLLSTMSLKIQADDKFIQKIKDTWGAAVPEDELAAVDDPGAQEDWNTRQEYGDPMAAEPQAIPGGPLGNPPLTTP